MLFFKIKTSTTCVKKTDGVGGVPRASLVHCALAFSKQAQVVVVDGVWQWCCVAVVRRQQHWRVLPRRAGVARKNYVIGTGMQQANRFVLLHTNQGATCAVSAHFQLRPCQFQQLLSRLHNIVHVMFLCCVQVFANPPTVDVNSVKINQRACSQTLWQY